MDDRNLNNEASENESNAAKRIRLLGIDDKDKIHDESATIKKGNFWSNLWYQHKWAIIIGGILLICCVTLIFTLANREEYDMHIAYTGPLYMDVETQAAVHYAFSQLMDDYDGNGEKNINFASITYQNDEQRKQTASEMQSNYGTILQIGENREALENIRIQLMSGTCAIYLMDYALYKEYEASMVNLKDFLGYAPSDYVSAGVSGVYFKKTDFYFQMYATEEGRALENLPDDTVLCLLPKLETMDDEMYDWSCDLFKNVLEFKIN